MNRRPSLRTSTTAPALLAALTLAACGGSSGGTTGAGGAGGTGTTSSSTTSTTSTTTSSSTTSTTATTGSGGSAAGGGGGGTTSTATTTTTSSTGGGCTPGDMQACYDGPANTEGVGQCHGGMKTCGNNGMFGACLGEQLPQQETCNTPFDDDCNGQTNEGGPGCVCLPNAVTACYTGPAGTEGVGICMGGTQTCDDQGLTEGACTGEVLPQIENCLLPADEDCDGTAQACTGAGLWGNRYGDVAAQTVSAVAVHLGGAIFAGSLTGSATFGGTTLTSAGLTDAFVASLDYTGATLWAKRFGDAANKQAATYVAVDGAGNTILVGNFAGSIDFGGGSLASVGLNDVFLAKLDPNGNYVWAKHFGDVNQQNIRGVAADAAGNIAITGDFTGTMNFGGGALTNSSTTVSDIFVAQFDTNGTHLWSHSFGDAAGAQSGAAVAIDGAGHVTVVGDLAGSATFGATMLTSAGSTDIFVASFDNAGNTLWAGNFGNTAAQTAAGIAVDSNNNVIITGNVAGTVNFGGGLLTSAGGTDVAVAKFTQGGVHDWSHIYGSAMADVARGVAVDPFGGVLLTGEFPTTINFGSTAATLLTSAGSTDIFVAKLEPNLGGYVWANRYGDNTAQLGGGVSADASGVLVVGNFNGSITIGGTTALTSAGATDMFAAKLSP